MPVIREYECEVCGAHFDIFHASRDEPPPDTCPHCGGISEAPRLPIPSGGHIGGSNIARSVDQMYKQTEKASEYRAEVAGDPTLKITNLRDNLREGDVAAMPVNNEVTRYAQEANHQYFSKDMSALVAGAKTGSIRDTGAVGLQAIQKHNGGHGPSPTVSSPAMSSGAGWGGGFGKR